MTLRPRNPRLLELEPFLVGRPESCTRFDLAPFGWRVRDSCCFDPLHGAAVPFLELLSRLDVAAFGAAGMSMPRWVFLDGAELTGGIAGLGCRASRLPEEVRGLFAVGADYKGLVPLAMYVAIPTFEAGTWMGHNLSSIASHFGDELRGLGSLAKALALRIFRVRRQVGAAQWGNRAMRVHARMGALELLTAWTPAHSEAATLTYRVEVDEACLLHLARDPAGRVELPEPDLWLDSADRVSLEALQAQIEAGGHFWVAGAPEELEPGRQRVPVARLSDGPGDSASRPSPGV